MKPYSAPAPKSHIAGIIVLVLTAVVAGGAFIVAERYAKKKVVTVPPLPVGPGQVTAPPSEPPASTDRSSLIPLGIGALLVAASGVALYMGRLHVALLVSGILVVIVALVMGSLAGYVPTIVVSLIFLFAFGVFGVLYYRSKQEDTKPEPPADNTTPVPTTDDKEEEETKEEEEEDDSWRETFMKEFDFEGEKTNADRLKEFESHLREKVKALKSTLKDLDIKNLEKTIDTHVQSAQGSITEKAADQIKRLKKARGVFMVQANLMLENKQPPAEWDRSKLRKRTEPEGKE